MCRISSILPKRTAGQRGVAGDPAPGLGDGADIAAGAERALAGAADQHSVDFRIGGPIPQHWREPPVHPQGEGVQRLRPVEGNGGNPASRRTGCRRYQTPRNLSLRGAERRSNLDHRQ